MLCSIVVESRYGEHYHHVWRDDERRAANWLVKNGLATKRGDYDFKPTAIGCERAKLVV